MNLVQLPTSVTQDGKAVYVDESILQDVLETARLFPEARVSSGYRTKAENAAAGGADQSDHLLGLAVDWVSKGKGLLQRLWSWATQQPFPYVEPLGQSGDHVHISYARGDSSPSNAGGTGGTTASAVPLGCATTLMFVLSAIVYLVLLPTIWHS